MSCLGMSLRLNDGGFETYMYRMEKVLPATETLAT